MREAELALGSLPPSHPNGTMSAQKERGANVIGFGEENYVECSL